MSQESAALGDLRVLDLSTRLSAAFAARLLGDHGADVVLLEPSEGHPVRHEAPFLGDVQGPERSLLHAYVNTSKRSATLPSDDSGRSALIRAADVIVVSDPSTAALVQDVAPSSAIVLAVTPYGLDTPMAEAPGTDLTTAAVTGWALINGDAGEPPLRPTLHQSEYMAGLVAYTGAVAALTERDRSGEGQLIDVCELEPMLWMAAPSILAAAQGDTMGRGRGQPGVFHGPVPTSDGYFSVTFSRPHFWVEAMKALGLDDLATDPRYTDRTVRQAEAPALQARIEEALAARDRWDLFNTLSRQRATVGIVLDMADIANSEHLETRGAFAETEVDGVTVRTLSSPCVMTETPWHLRSPAPRLGEHTDQVMAEWAAGGTEAAR